MPVPAVAGLIMDGVFLMRRELAGSWDLTVYLDVHECVTIERARARDSVIFGDPDEIERRYRAKYLPGQQLYRSREQPIQRADLVIDTSYPDRPHVLVDRRQHSGSNLGSRAARLVGE
jgi:uridine kinase